MKVWESFDSSLSLDPGFFHWTSEGLDDRQRVDVGGLERTTVSEVAPEVLACDNLLLALSRSKEGSWSDRRADPTCWCSACDFGRVSPSPTVAASDC
jgi:hypothetical protein